MLTEDDLESKRRQTKEFESTMNRTKQAVDSLSAKVEMVNFEGFKLLYVFLFEVQTVD